LAKKLIFNTEAVTTKFVAIVTEALKQRKRLQNIALIKAE